MKDYSKAKIYSIRSAQTDKVYIGSTTETLARRLATHRNHYNSWKNGIRKYVASFELLQYPEYYIELVENHPCEGIEELGRREGEVTRLTPNYVNKKIEGRTPAEYREDHKEIKNQKFDCECGSPCTHSNKQRHLKTKKHQNWINNN
jgi:hypothetical protein